MSTYSHEHEKTTNKQTRRLLKFGGRFEKAPSHLNPALRFLQATGIQLSYGLPKLWSPKIPWGAGSQLLTHGLYNSSVYNQIIFLRLPFYQVELIFTCVAIFVWFMKYMYTFFFFTKYSSLVNFRSHRYRMTIDNLPLINLIMGALRQGGQNELGIEQN